eukprot:653336-Pyramimonas_sp.AAC.1
MSADAKSRVAEAGKARHHADRVYVPGQWVYVWRKLVGAKTHSLQRDRWVGPGAVVYQRGTT